MTEYDFSPQAYERHLATQTRISSWVNETNGHAPANPFLPLPGEHGSFVSPNSQPPSSSQPQQTGTSSSYHAIRQVSPSYTSHSSSSSKPKRSHQSRHGSRSFQPSPQFGIPMPLGGMYTAATQTQLAQPMMTGPSSVAKSYSTPPSVMVLPYHSSPVPQNPTFFYVTSPYAPSVTGSTPMQHSVTSPAHQIQPQQFAQVYSPAYSYQYQYSPPPISSDSPPDNVHSAPAPTTRTGSVQSLLLSPTPSSGGVSYVQPHPHQPIVIPIGEGGKNGYIVVPAAGQQVQVISSQYHAHYPSPGEESDDSDKEHATQSFFGSLGLGKKAKGSSRKENKYKKRKSKT